jgi:hypothetical protein
MRVLSDGVSVATEQRPIGRDRSEIDMRVFELAVQLRTDERMVGSTEVRHTGGAQPVAAAARVEQSNSPLVGFLNDSTRWTTSDRAAQLDLSGILHRRPAIIPSGAGRDPRLHSTCGNGARDGRRTRAHRRMGWTCLDLGQAGRHYQPPERACRQVRPGCRLDAIKSPGTPAGTLPPAIQLPRHTDTGLPARPAPFACFILVVLGLTRDRMAMPVRCAASRCCEGFRMPAHVGGATHTGGQRTKAFT